MRMSFEEYRNSSKQSRSIDTDVSFDGVDRDAPQNRPKKQKRRRKARQQHRPKPGKSYDKQSYDGTGESEEIAA